MVTVKTTLPKYTILLVTLSLCSQSAVAALLDKSKVDEGGQINAPGGTIAKSLADQIGPGVGDEYEFGSSTFLIKRDPIRSVRRGRQLFQRKFSLDEGLGPRVNYGSTGNIVTERRLGAGFADSCASCHGGPRGSAGVGGTNQTFPDGRDAPHLFGVGIVEQIADEITYELRLDRDIAIRRAMQNHSAYRMDMWAKNVYYGYIVAYPDGTIDSTGLEGVDHDLRVKPFFAEGRTTSIREFINGAFKEEMGLQVYDPVLCAATDPKNPRRVISNSRFVFDPALDTFERPIVCDNFTDQDGDGIAGELDPAVIDHLEFYLLNYFKPATGKITAIERNGLQHMENIGCTSCHVKDMTINVDRRVADIETVYDPVKGIFNEVFATVNGRFQVIDDGQPYPLLEPEYKSFEVKNIFSDFKRHDLGPKFHERDYDGSVITEHMTEALWGVGSTSPYGHDGRSISLDQVIRRHGGEAQSSRDAYVHSLSDMQRLELQQFLEALILFPPDDTASNLNPGNPQTNNPQSPAEHGNIKLPVLFQTDMGPE